MFGVNASKKFMSTSLAKKSHLFGEEIFGMILFER